MDELNVSKRKGLFSKRRFCCKFSPWEEGKCQKLNFFLPWGRGELFKLPQGVN